jgi:beta-lactamase regulating signal transducer with metallopeptidase domain
MIPFTYSFCMAMLHSFWQAALLMLLYIIVDHISHKNSAPLAKRNFLYLTITAQLILFISTFLIYYFNGQVTGVVSSTIQNITNALGSPGVKIITPWIFSGYVFIIAGKLIQVVHNWYQFKLQYKTGLQKPGVDLKLFTELKGHQFGIKRKVNLWLSHSIQTPLTFGYFKPIILLPVALVNNISQKQAETLILHELTHIRTHDYLLNWFLVIAETIFFFNPFITGLCKKIKLEREKHCDLNVMSFEYAPALYAETLLHAERIKQLSPVFQMAAVNHKNHLLQRIRFFTGENVMNQTLRFNIVAPLIGLLLLFMLSTAVLFQSQKSTTQLQAATGIYFLPADNYIISKTETNTPVFTNKILNEKFSQTNKRVKPVFIGEQNQIKPLTKPVYEPEPEVTAETTSPAELNIARPVTTRENDAAREIIITEQGSGGTTVKVYTLVFDNGKWILQPELAITNQKIMVDSITQKIDSLKGKLNKVFPDQQ